MDTQKAAAEAAKVIADHSRRAPSPLSEEWVRLTIINCIANAAYGIDIERASARHSAYWEGYDRGVIDGKAGGPVMPGASFVAAEKGTGKTRSPDRYGGDDIFGNTRKPGKQADFILRKQGDA